ncbi:MAG: SDR family oxidoreductase [Anaerolineae bacterium]|nr:SDR family oxidoreductase [Anaerolineae bacterium]
MYSDKPFSDRVILVTGAAQGIGYASAQRFAELGGRVVLLDKLAAEAEAAVAVITDHGGRASAVIADATDSQEVEDAVAAMIADYGRIDVLVNNIGWNKPTPFLESDEAFWQELLDINLMTALRFCRAILPHMIDRHYGRIVNIASIAGIHPWPGSVIYGVAKAGIVSMTRSLAAAMAQHNIRVNCVCPGPTETGLSKALRVTNPDYVKAVHGMVTLGRLADPGEIARAICFLASDDASFVLGECLVVDGGYNMV